MIENSSRKFFYGYIVVIASLGVGLKMLQSKYLPGKEIEFKTPVFINDSFETVDAYFNFNSNMTEEERDKLFDSNF